ncbi:MAG TPA: biopolymer transporter ExbD [Planctomycetota bacterium]|nr:biopolymer transporter ExbD [Planctomycetota bacterium]
MKRKRNDDSPPAELQMTSMIDVTFLLLIFFLLGTRFKEPQGRLNAYLPKERGPNPINLTIIEPKEELVVRVRMEKGRKLPYYQVGELVFRKFEELEATLYKCYRGRQDQPVTIDPDASAPYERVLWVLDTCMKIGYKEIVFSAPIPDGQQLPGARNRPDNW